MTGGSLPARWEPLRRIDNSPDFTPNPAQVAAYKAAGVRPEDEIWWNDRYQVRVRFIPPEGQTTGGTREGLVHLSINSHDRGPVRNWRHMQQIKNEVMGEDRWAVEIFPSEDHLADTSNQYHLWVMPEGQEPGFGFRDRFVSTPEDVERFNGEREAGLHQGRQEEWEPGLTTGQRESDASMYGTMHRGQREKRPPAGQPPSLGE